MPRNRHFVPDREPLKRVENLRLQHAHGPLSFLNPTQARYSWAHGGDQVLEQNPSENWHRAEPQRREQHASNIGYHWTSRNNRKGRHQLVITPANDPDQAKFRVPESTSSPQHVFRVILRMFTDFPFWDVSWLVAFIFTWGSIVWVINAFFEFLPLVRPSTEFDNEVLTGGGVTAFVGATIFEVGSFFLMLEAVNENRTGDFGWAVRTAYEDHHERSGATGSGTVSNGALDQEKAAILRVEPGHCSHHHPNRKNLVGKAEAHLKHTTSASSGVGTQDSRAWVWFPTWHELKTHYLHELGFIACLAQLIGATIFWISGFTALPGILNNLSLGLTIGIYWTPQVVGGTGFIISGALFMLETQRTWYLPAPGVLGWWIGAWNLVGGIGFTLCPAFGYDKSSWAQFQASCSTFWASWAFLIGSLIQLYESLEKQPVQVENDTPEPQLNVKSSDDLAS